ncbi:MAG: DUF1572 domain-containing protein [Oceanihabitans sp.]
MEWTAYLTNRLKEVLTEGKWVTGTNFKSEIINLNWEQATKKIANYNTIAEITFHIHYYIAGVSKVLEGGSLDIKDKFSFNATPIKNESDWTNLVQLYCKDATRLIALVENLTEEKLFSDFTQKQYGNYYRNIDLIIEHTYYHLGQILLIKKQIK